MRDEFNISKCFSVRVSNGLINEDILDFKTLDEMTDEQLLEIPSFGSMAIKQIHKNRVFRKSNITNNLKFIIINV